MIVGAGEVLELLVMGAAVSFEKAPGSLGAPSGKPFTSDLSGRDLFQAAPLRLGTDRRGGHGVEFAAATPRHDRRARPEPPGPGCPPRSARPT